MSVKRRHFDASICFSVMAEERRQNAGNKCTSCTLFCAVCRILCYTCIKRCCCRCCFEPAAPREREEVAILVLGLQGAGKTTLLSAMASELSDNEAEPPPTMGFAFKAVNVQDHLTLNFQELGGSEQIRLYWEHYFSCKHIVVFVVNSGSSGEGLREASGVLRHCLSSPSLSGLPLLLVCSKQDSPSAKTTTQMREGLGVEEIEQERRVMVVSSSCREIQDTRERVTNAILELLDTQTDPIENI